MIFVREFNMANGEVLDRELSANEIFVGELPRITVVTMRQARPALLQQGLLSLVEAAIDALPEPSRQAARIEWDYSSEVHRNKPFVQLLVVALGLTEEQLDALFTLASTL